MFNSIRNKWSGFIHQTTQTRFCSDKVAPRAGDGLVGHDIKMSQAHFGDMVRAKSLLVDKTALIPEFLYSSAKVSLITRPRRFGKTLNLSMLQHFFANRVHDQLTQGLFADFRVAQDVAFMQQHQGQYPVISVTFKDVKEASYEATIRKLVGLFKELYSQHTYLLTNKNLDEMDKIEFKKYWAGEVNEQELASGLQFLSKFLYKAHGYKKGILLIDEYDAPLGTAYTHGFLEPLGRFMENMLSAALKDNPYISKGLMTGVLCIAQSGMLSGLNNLELFTVLDREYQSFFGFTEAEVAALVQRRGITTDFSAIKQFYNGYKIGQSILYNPWSIMHFIRRAEFKPYWVLTANDSMLKQLLVHSRDEDKDKLEALIQGQTVACEINPNLRYDQLMADRGALWTFLLFTGYLTAEAQTPSGSRYIGQLKIPNEEILSQYREVFIDDLKDALGEQTYDSFLKDLVAGKVDAFTDALNTYMLNTLSVKDVGGTKAPPERFYHGFVIGLIASLYKTYWISSNKESGLGFYDVMLIPKVETGKTLAITLEFKRDKTDMQHKNEEEVMAILQKQADGALRQIDEKQYGQHLKQYSHITSCLKIGLAFSNKRVVSSHQTDRIDAAKQLSRQSASE